MSAKNVEKSENFTQFYQLYKSLIKDGYTKEEIKVLNFQMKMYTALKKQYKQ